MKPSLTDNINRQRQVAISDTELQTLAPQRFTVPSAPSPNVMLLCIRLQVPKHNYYYELFWYLCPEAKIRPRKHMAINDISSPCSGAHRLLQKQTTENVFKLNCYQPQNSQAYSIPCRKQRTAICQALPAVWVQNQVFWNMKP
jgi:hypothetical protein